MLDPQSLAGRAAGAANAAVGEPPSSSTAPCDVHGGNWSLMERIKLARAVAEVGHHWDAVGQQLHRSYGSAESMHAKFGKLVSRHGSSRCFESAATLLRMTRDEAVHEEIAKLPDAVHAAQNSLWRKQATARMQKQWCEHGLCSAGLSVAECGRWIDGAGCDCTKLLQVCRVLAPYNICARCCTPLLTTSFEVAALDLCIGREQVHTYGKGWVPRPDAQANESLLMRAPKEAGECEGCRGWHRPHTCGKPKRKRTSGESNSASAEGAESVACPACRGRKRAHTCGKPRATSDARAQQAKARMEALAMATPPRDACAEITAAYAAYAIDVCAETPAADA